MKAACVGCGSKNLIEAWRLSGSDLRKLDRAADRLLSERAYGRLAPNTDVVLSECKDCGFQFFDPELAGSGEYYAELDRVALQQGKESYYTDSRPEFEYALSFCSQKGINRILDVGCGRGVFLTTAKARNLETHGIEINPDAVEAAKKAGHHVLGKPISQIETTDFGGAFKFASLFQVLEHVSDPIAFVLQTLRLVDDGGYLMIAVPSRIGSFRLLPLDPANMPPHHVSLWRPEDMHSIASRCGARVVDEGHDGLYGSGIAGMLIKNRQFLRALDRPLPLGGDWLPSLLGFVYSKLGIRHFHKGKGLSLYAILQKTGAKTA